MLGWQRGDKLHAKSAAASRVAVRKESFESGSRLTVGQSALAGFGDSRHNLCVARVLDSDTSLGGGTVSYLGGICQKSAWVPSNSVPFSVPLEILLPRISKYLGSPSRGLKLL